MNSKKVVTNISIFLLVFLLGLIGIEYAFRAMIFSDKEAFKKFRDPWAYADMDSEDLFWKLYTRWIGVYKPPECPHPLLGWIGDFSRHSLMHWRFDSFESKRPVLLYGDSFAICSGLSTCFQTILNDDSAFSQQNYLYNYGVGGYGVDQIYLLFDKTYKSFEKPFVIFSLLTFDLDRSILHFRTGQKPFFEVEDDSLVLKGVPINSNPEEYLDANPTRTISYLWRKFLYSKENFLPKKTVDKLKGTNRYTRKKIEVNEKILLKTLNELRENNIEFVFVIFHTLQYDRDNYTAEEENDWRNVFLKNFLEENKVPYIWTRDLILNDTTFDKFDISKYILGEDGHPTTYFNTLIAEEMKRVVLASPAKLEERRQNDDLRKEQIFSGERYGNVDVGPTDKNFFDYHLQYYKDYLYLHERLALIDAAVYKQLKVKSDTMGVSMDHTLRNNAMWRIYEKEKNCIQK
ncbi:MAG: hypothetical protein JW731_04695 [Bacteroidales bacterium]|nr:hypothetical protein [Bacteroidales bacterium]